MILAAIVAAVVASCGSCPSQPCLNNGVPMHGECAAQVRVRRSVARTPACRYPMFGENGKWFNEDQTYLVITSSTDNKRPWRIKKHAIACRPSADQFVLSPKVEPTPCTWLAIPPLNVRPQAYVCAHVDP